MEEKIIMLWLWAISATMLFVFVFITLLIVVRKEDKKKRDFQKGVNHIDKISSKLRASVIEIISLIFEVLYKGDYFSDVESGKKFGAIFGKWQITKQQEAFFPVNSVFVDLLQETRCLLNNFPDLGELIDSLSNFLDDQPGFFPLFNETYVPLLTAEKLVIHSMDVSLKKDWIDDFNIKLNFYLPKPDLFEKHTDQPEESKTPSDVEDKSDLSALSVHDEI